MGNQTKGSGIGAYILPAALLLAPLAIGCDPGAPADAPATDSDDPVVALEARLQGSWVPLGGNLDSTPAAVASRPSLAFDDESRPLVAFSVADSTRVLRWRRESWAPVGAPLAGGGPFIATDSQGRIAACLGGTVTTGPFAARWSGSSWTPLGGDIGVETGYKGARYSYPTCAGIVVDGSDAPIVAWSADVGAKANFLFVAGWMAHSHRWRGLDPTISSRATEGSLDIDNEDRAYAATFTPDGSYGGGATTRVWRFQDGGWLQLGPDMPQTTSPVIAVRNRGTIYLALADASNGTISVERWRGGAWTDLPSPGAGSNLALALTPSGKPVLAWVDAAPPNVVRTGYFANRAWHPLGAEVADVSGQTVSLDLKVDPRGHATIAWMAGSEAAGFAVRVDRFNAALP